MILFLLASAFGADLNDAWNAAEDRDRETTMVHETRVQSDVTRFRAIAGLLPTVSAGIDYNINQYQVLLDFKKSLPPNLAALAGDVKPTVIQKKTFFDGQISASMPLLYASGYAMLRYADASIDSGRAKEASDMGKLRASIARAYWGVLVARKADDLAERSVKLAQDFLAIAERQDQAGSVAPIAVLQAKLSLTRALRERESASAQRKVAEEQFAGLTGLPGDSPLEMLEPRPVPFSSLQEAQDAVLGDSPDVRMARDQSRGASAYRLAKHLEWVPRIDAHFTEMASQNRSFNPHYWNWNAGISLSIPIWDGGNRAANQLDAASKARQAMASETKAEDDARVAALQAWTERERAQQALASVQAEVSLAQETLRVAELSFGQGQSIFTELEDARLAMDRAELAMVQEKMAADLAAIDLLRVAGLL